AEDGIRDFHVTGVQTCALPILGFTYIGPIDGHKITDLIEVFNIASNIAGPTLVHVVTKKGKGYEHAERHPELYHGISSFNIKTRSEEHTSELQSRENLVCRLLL